ncbi:MAG: DinB family protein [Gemmatimonadetes bacterium]|nr:DinB family protein [Gemmatimonadota bacterium]
MSSAALTFRELADYTRAESERWHKWLASRPESVLELPVGTGRTATVRGLVHHIIVVERRYIDRLRDEPVTTYEAIPSDSLDAMFASFADGRERLDAWLATATDEDLARRLEFVTISAGTLTGSARKIVSHLLLHGVRHWAQLATSLRQQGHATDWAHDLLLSDVME